MLKRISTKMSFLLVLSMLMTVLVAVPTSVQAAPSFELVGFATLNGGTSGGTGGTEVTATSLSQVNDLLSARKKNKDTSPLIIKFDRKLTGSEVIACKEVSNITFLGVGTKGELDGFGINVVKSKNIIIQNLKIHHTRAPMDAIGIENSQNVWVDHCELYNMIGDCNGDGVVTPNDGDTSGGDVDWYDGLLDIKKSSEYITVSWTYMHDSYKTSLIGSSDSDDYDRKITFHHNVYSNLKSRTPSYRGGTGHMFNNYYVDISGSGINSRVSAKLRIEGNVFENIGSGSMDSKTGFAEGPIGAYYSSEIGYWDVKDNIFVNCKGNQPTTSTCSFNPPYNYSHVLQPASEVKETVLQYAGVQGGTIPSPSTQPTSTPPTTTPTPTSTSTPPQNTQRPDVVYGDLNRDGNINSTDLTLMKRYLLKVIDLTEAQFKASDLNLDNKVNSTDNTILKRYVLKMIDRLPISGGTPTPTPTSYPWPTPTPTSNPIDGDIILEPNGSMGLVDAINSIQPGKTIYLKAGTYNFSKTIVIEEGNDGLPGAMKTLAAYGDGAPIINFSAMAENSANRGVVLGAKYWHIKGITIKEAGDNGMLLSGHNNIIDGCIFTENHDSGLQLSRYNTSYNSIDKWPSNNLIVDCISTLNFDSGLEDADGFAPKLTCGEGNIFRNCKALYNCDDGWDMYTKSTTGRIGVIVLENCEAIGNGYDMNGNKTGGDGNGYKLGDDTASVAHILKNCVANNNAKHGFTGNGNPAKIIMENCGGSGNAQKLFDRLDNAQFN